MGIYKNVLLFLIKITDEPEHREGQLYFSFRQLCDDLAFCLLKF